MYKACPPPTHFFRMKFRVDEVLRGSVEPFRVLIQSGPFGSSFSQFRSNFRVMNPLVSLFGRATTWRCQYDINFGVWGRSCHWILLLGVHRSFSIALLNTRLGVSRVISTCCFRAANESWLSVSRKRTTFNTPPQWVGMMSSCDEIKFRKQLSGHLMETHSLVSSTITPIMPAIAMPLAAL